MKIFSKILLRTAVVILFVAAYGTARPQGSFVTVSGQLKDAKTGEKIAYASITVPNTNIGTVSNSDGKFILKVNSSLNAEYFEVSHLSYATTKFKISESVGKDKTFYLEIRPIQLQSMSVVPGDAKSIVEMAMQNIEKNYSAVPNMMTGFYRESIRQRRDYLSVSEAVVDIYKAPYDNREEDLVKIFKGRKGSDVKKADTLMVQLQGGPNVTMLLDIVKYSNLSIALENLDNYKFEFESVANIDNELNWVIGFSPIAVREDPLYIGKLYISQDNMAITQAEFSLDLQDENKASGMFIQKKPAGLRFKPESTSYMVTYKKQGSKYFLSYVRVELKFRCDWKKRLFKNHYTVISELAITDRRTDNIIKFAKPDLFRSDMIFTEKVRDLTDTDFWGENNIIEPENSIENAIKKLSKGMKK
jgi:hypothetical protein